MSTLLKLNRVIPDTNQPQVIYSKPKVEKNRIVFIKSTQFQTIGITKFIDYNPKHTSYHTFFSAVLDRYLEEHLITKTHLAENVGTDTQFHKNYVEYSIEIKVSLKGSEQLQPIFDVFNKVTWILQELLTEKMYEIVKKEKQDRFILMDKETNAFDLASSLLQNFQDFGPENLFSGPDLIDLEFDEAKILEIKENFYREKMIITVLSNFDYSPSVEKVDMDSDILKMADLSKIYSVKDVLSKRLSDHQFLGEGKIKQGLIELHFKHPEHSVIFGYIDLDDKISNSFTGNLEFKQNDFKITQDTLDKIQDEPSGLEELVETSKSFVVKLNTKFPLSALSFFISIYPERSKISKETDIDLSLIALVWNRRLKLINNDLHKYKSKVYFIAKMRHIVINIDCILDNLQKIVELVKSEILEAKEFMTPEELKFALDVSYVSMGLAKPVYQQGFNILSDYIFENFSLEKPKKIEYLRKIKNQKFESPSFQVGQFYLEGYTNDKITSFIKENLLEVIDPDFDPLKNFDKSPYKVEIQGFEQDLTKVITFKKKPLDDPNEIYSHVFWIGGRDDLKLLSNAMVLSKILADESFDYLRTKNKLGYIATTTMKTYADQLFIVLLLQTNNISKARVEVENFYRLMSDYVQKMSMVRFNVVKGTIASSLSQMKNSLYEESHENFGFFEDDLGFGFKKKLLNEVVVGVTKMSVYHLLRQMVMFRTNRKVIVDSGVDLKGKGGYSIEGVYDDGEVYQIAEMPN